MQSLEARLVSEGLKVRTDLHKLEITKEQIGKKSSRYVVRSVFKADKSIQRLEGKYFNNLKFNNKRYRIRNGYKLFQT